VHTDGCNRAAKQGLPTNGAMGVAKKVEVVTDGAMGVVINETEVMTSGTMSTTKEKEGHTSRGVMDAVIKKWEAMTSGALSAVKENLSTKGV
jgi:hypothetical protein